MAGPGQGGPTVPERDPLLLFAFKRSLWLQETGAEKEAKTRPLLLSK